MKKILLIALLSICQFAFSQDRGTVTGTVTDKEMGGEPLPFANVFIKGTTIGSTTDMDGKYTIQAPVGQQTIVFSFVGYQTVEKPILVKAGQTITVDQEVGASEGVALDEVVIKGNTSKEKASALLTEQKKAVVIKESIGAQELSKKGISDAAGAVAKISGVSKQEGSSNVYVRGLGDRYLNTTMNGLTLPSNDIEKKNIDLGLFPSDIIQNVSISKAYSPEFYGDFAAGNVNITSKEYKGKGFFEVNLGSGFSTRALFEGSKKSPGTGSFGYYGRYRHHPFAIVLGTNVNPVDGGVPVNSSIGINAGKSFDFENDSRLSLFITASFQNDYEYREGPVVDFTNVYKKQFPNAKEYEYSTLTTVMANVLYRIDDTSTLKYTSMFLNSSSDEVGYYGFKGQGKNRDARINTDKGFFQQNVQFNQDLIFVNQLTGEHKFLEGKHKLSWGVGYNRVFSHEPDRKRFSMENYQNALDSDPATTAVLYSNNSFDNQRYFQKIKDEELNSRINFGLEASENVTLNIGYNGRLKLRNFSSVRYGYDFNNKEFPFTNVNNLNPVFSATNFTKAYNTEILKPIKAPKWGTTNLPGLPDNTYKGELNIHAGYVSAVIKGGEKWTIVPGVRLESFSQKISYDVINLPATDSRFRSAYDNFLLPSLNIKYALNDEQNLRFTGSKTVSVPEFKEVAPFVYEGVSQRIGGNPDLLSNPSFSAVYNVDLKYEWFISRGELFSVALFGKQINDPVNLVVAQDATGTQRFFRTGDKAKVLGVEVELRKNLILNEDEETQLAGGLNVTYMHTEQDLKPVNGVFSTSFGDRTTEKLQGASPLLVNANLDYSPTHFENYKPTLSLVFSYFSDRIDALGSGTLGNIVEKSVSSLDFVWKNRFGENIEVNFSAKNLLDPNITRLRENTSFGDVILSQYKRGRGLSLGLKYKF